MAAAMEVDRDEEDVVVNEVDTFRAAVLASTTKRTYMSSTSRFLMHCWTHFPTIVTEHFPAKVANQETGPTIPARSEKDKEEDA